MFTQNASALTPDFSQHLQSVNGKTKGLELLIWKTNRFLLYN